MPICVIVEKSVFSGDIGLENSSMFGNWYGVKIPYKDLILKTNTSADLEKYNVSACDLSHVRYCGVVA